MGVVYRSSLRTTRMSAVLTDIDSGAGAATLEICTAAYATVLLTFTLSDPSGVVAGDALTLSGMPKNANASAGGVAAVARIKESGGTVVADGLTVGTSGANIIISNTTITNGAAYSLTSGVLTHNTSGV
jgi:hypothetical protein